MKCMMDIQTVFDIFQSVNFMNSQCSNDVEMKHETVWKKKIANGKYKFGI